MAHYLGVDQNDVVIRYLSDPVASVQTDLQLLRANPLIPRTLIASGVVYDIATGRVSVICPPAPLAEIS